jgi:predicted AAA+ superfamily ATPase
MLTDHRSGSTISPMSYRPRIVDTELGEALASAGAVLIEGPKACGKTETARRAARSEVLLDVDARARQAAAIDPSLVLDGAEPRLIDEWQREPEIWNHIRRTVDERRGTGHFILTGSSVPPDDETRHVGAGRIIRLRMRPMTLSESGRSTGTVSLAAVLDGGAVRAADPGLTIGQLADLVCVGGWPGNLDATVAQAQRLLRGYLMEVARVEVQRADGMRRDPQIVARLLRSLARNVGTPTSLNVLRTDVNGSDGSLKSETLASYLDALGRLMITEDLPAWAPSLRSRTRLRAAPVRHFVDPSLAVAAVRATPTRLLGDVNWLGLLFESLVVRDLRVYAQALDAQVFAYRDETGLEADAIIEMPDGGWAAFEVKLGHRDLDLAAQHLLRIKNRVDTTAAGEPLALAVITATGYGYVRDDGVAVIPIGALTA